MSVSFVQQNARLLNQHLVLKNPAVLPDLTQALRELGYCVQLDPLKPLASDTLTRRGFAALGENTVIRCLSCGQYYFRNSLDELPWLRCPYCKEHAINFRQTDSFYWHLLGPRVAFRYLGHTNDAILCRYEVGDELVLQRILPYVPLDTAKRTLQVTPETVNNLRPLQPLDVRCEVLYRLGKHTYRSPDKLPLPLYLQLCQSPLAKQTTRRTIREIIQVCGWTGNPNLDYGGVFREDDFDLAREYIRHHTHLEAMRWNFLRSTLPWSFPEAYGYFAAFVLGHQFSELPLEIRKIILDATRYGRLLRHQAQLLWFELPE